MTKTCIVTAYFRIPSKKPHEWYTPYLINFVKNVSGNVIFFTEEEVMKQLTDMVDTTHIRFVLMNFKDINAFKNFDQSFWKRQYERDPERYHSPELGAIWYEKKEFVLKAINMVDSEIFIWCDAGCVRDTIACMLMKNFGKRCVDMKHGIHLQRVGIIGNKKFYSFNDVSIAGAIIAGDRDSWKTLKVLYDDTLREYDSNKVCGISDQYILLSCVDKIPTFFYLCDQDSSCNPWFKFLEIL